MLTAIGIILIAAALAPAAVVGAFIVLVFPRGGE